MCAQRARKMYDEAAAERKKRKPKDSVPDNCPEQTRCDARDQVGETFGVSGKSVDRAAKVIKDGIPEIAEAVDSNEITIPWNTTRRHGSLAGFCATPADYPLLPVWLEFWPQRWFGNATSETLAMCV
jgi:hypothetical protein